MKDASNTIHLQIIGPAVLVGPGDAEAEAGIATFLLRSTDSSGQGTINATSSGLDPDSENISLVELNWEERQNASEIIIEANDTNRLKIASSFLIQQPSIRDETQNFLMLIRENPDQFNPKEIETIAESGTTIFLLSNFEEKGPYPKIA